MTIGHRSAQVWDAQADARRDLEDAILADAGHTRADAPRALLLAVSGLAQAALVRDGAFARIVAHGGPLTGRSRATRAYHVWLTALERVHRGLTLVGLRRVPRHVDPLAAIHQALAAQAETPRPPASGGAGDDIVTKDDPS